MKACRYVFPLLIGFVAPLAPGQERQPLPPPSASVAPLAGSVRVQFDRAEVLWKDGPADEVWEAYRRIIDTHGDRLIQRPAMATDLPAGFVRYTTMRELGWMRLATLRQTAPEAFAGFRRQLDPQAKRWFEQAKAERNTALFQRIVDEFFLSSWGDDALLRLGDLALERGDYNAARRHWERLAPGLRFVPNQHEQLSAASNRPLWSPFAGVSVAKAWPLVAALFSGALEATELVYPDSDLNLGEVRGRQVIVSLLEGNHQRAAIELEILNRMHPGAEGTIAGRSGKLGEMLLELATQARNWPNSATGTDWLTFAGSTKRQRTLPEVSAVGSEPLWSVSLPKWSLSREFLSADAVRVAEDSHRLLPYHPLIVNDLAVIQTGPRRDHVQSHRLRTGEPTLPESDSPPSPKEFFERQLSVGVPRLTPSVEGTILFSLEGFPFGSGVENRQGVSAKVVAIDLAADRKLIWEYSPIPPDWSEQFTIAGSPTVAASHVLCALRRREAGREETYVAALDSRDGRLLWRQLISVAEPISDPKLSELTNLLLTVVGDTVYCNTNDGLVAAIELQNGRLRWATAYPRTGLEDPNPDRNKLHWFRDLNPCLIHQDVLVVAAADSNRLFALDATTGIVLWSTPAELAADSVHLLGVSENRLVVSGECLYWFDVYTGSLLGRYPEPFKAAAGFARPSPRGYGRGVLLGQHVYWPTRDAIVIFGSGTGSRTVAWRPNLTRTIELTRHGATGGNLIWGNNTLLIAGSDQLLAFDAPQVP